MEKSEQKLGDVNAGDTVFGVSHNTWYGITIISRKVKKVTATQVVLDNDIRVRKDDGCEVGYRGYGGTRYEPYTKTRHDELKFINQKTKVQNILAKLTADRKWMDAYPIEVLEQISALLEKK